MLGVDVGAVDDPAAAVVGLLPDGSAANDLRIDRGQVGAGYGTLTEPVKEAMVLAARLEGVLLDPTYTGRALAGLIAAARRGEIEPGTVFVHTGGLPGVFGHAEVLAYAESLAT